MRKIIIHQIKCNDADEDTWLSDGDEIWARLSSHQGCIYEPRSGKNTHNHIIAGKTIRCDGFELEFTGSIVFDLFDDDSVGNQDGQPVENRSNAHLGSFTWDDWSETVEQRWQPLVQGARGRDAQYEILYSLRG